MLTRDFSQNTGFFVIEDWIQFVTT